MTGNPQFIAQDAEASVLGAILINPDIIPDLGLEGKHFQIHRHRWIWEAVFRLYDEDVKIDALTIANELERSKKLKEIGGQAFLASLVTSTPTYLHAFDHAEILKKKWGQQQVERLGEELQRINLNGSDPEEKEKIFRELGEVFLKNGRSESKYRVRNAAFALENQQPSEYIVQNLFGKGSVSVIPGAPGTKKTYSLLSCGVCVAMGEPWLRFNTKKSNVLFVDEESGEKRLSRRLGEVLRGEFGDETTAINFISLAQFDLRDPVEAVLLQDLIVDLDAEFVIIDALADIMPGADENAVKDVHPVFMRLRRMAEETGAAIVIIHHTNKGGGFRGSTAISGAVDLMLIMESKKDEARIEFKTEKARDIEPISFSAEAHWSDGKFWMTDCDPREKPKTFSKAQKYVLKYLLKNGPSLVGEIQSDPKDCTEAAAKRAVYDLAGDDLITRIDEGGPGVPATYSLTEKGNSFANAEANRENE